MKRFKNVGGGGDLKLAPQGFPDGSYLENEPPKKSSQLLKTKAGLLRQKSHDDRFGFTLAEVLIALGIIGIVAAMTLPSLIEKHQKRVTAERLKKMYTTLRTAIDLAELDNGERENWSFADYNEGKEFYATQILPHMNCIKIVNNGNLPSCYFADGSYILGSVLQPYGLLEVLFYPFSSKNYTSGKAKGAGKRYRLYYSTYVNQRFESIQFFGNVNKYTRDYLLNSGPSGFSCKGGDPRSCFYIIMRDNWEIKDDYPW